MKHTAITLKDIEKRVDMLRTVDNIPKCVHKDCNNPIDGTSVGGWDTACPYHRLLYDYWLYEILGDEFDPEMPKAERNKLYDAWEETITGPYMDEIVLMMANDPLNWDC